MTVHRPRGVAVAGCRIGFVGAGGVARRHAGMLAEFDDTRLISVTDVDPDRARSFATDFGLRAVPDAQAVLDSGVDAVYVCVPPFAHGPVELRVAEAGAALFVEKPLGLDAATAETIAERLEQTGVVASVGHHWRYSPAVGWAREVLADHDVRLLMGAWLDKIPPVSWWANRSRSGGQVIEQAIHVLDLARLLVGEVAEVHAFADGRPPDSPGTTDFDVDGATVANLRFRDGAVGTLAATCLLRWKHRAGLEICADGLALTLTEDALEMRNGDAAPQMRPIDPEGAKRAADRAFVDAVLGRGEDLRTPYSDALRTHRLACAIARSAREGAPVRLPEAHDVLR
ncbi:oxidoreductase [Amycolatopsis coloradensis]|uniref:Oxidoreductase n=1 Tax=Amycolatopsis coloradensis TaxID=76021 RepID=A0A1R0L3X5_9PSEU|nr:Gfo/Idh/MocA family oxidoreductase [Amycolatopsis coloradensis]OLZ57388.1 oxidoreductase [Amycolatopsis coloradensis]